MMCTAKPLMVTQHPQLTDQHKFELFVPITLNGDAVTILEDLVDNRIFTALDDAIKVAYSQSILGPSSRSYEL